MVSMVDQVVDQNAIIRTKSYRPFRFFMTRWPAVKYNNIGVARPSV